jgi:hypothetical protein
MSMLLIKGLFQVKGGQPDRDSVHFTPGNPAEWNLVRGAHRVKRNGLGRSQLRLDAIDALETHYQSTVPRVHQPLAFAHAAADELLAWLGFTGVQRTPQEIVTAATPESVPGFILTRGADIHARCVALVGSGEPPGASGTGIFVDTALLKTTVNHHRLSAGLAYPTYYRNLFPDLRAEPCPDHRRGPRGRQDRRRLSPPPIAAAHRPRFPRRPGPVGLLPPLPQPQWCRPRCTRHTVLPARNKSSKQGVVTAKTHTQSVFTRLEPAVIRELVRLDRAGDVRGEEAKGSGQAIFRIWPDFAIGA